ncbi:MAG TPA: FAD-binding protein [Gammaproteobacteria bacterium]|nr:FAD-binding protein [Gammaproteobacteria bacterium]
MALQASQRAVLEPRDAADVAEILRTHARALEPLGAGSKRAIGAPVDADALDLSALRGIVDYEPAELVLIARQATPLAEIESALDSCGQRLAFEPPDFGRLLGVDAPQTQGGVLAANLAGSRRLTAGAARDHFLGFEAVTGDGVRFKAGGKVVKNVTGYDLPKLIAGSWGTLAVLTSVTVRVVPQAETEATLFVPVSGADRAEEGAERAVAMLERALASPNDVSAAGYDPARGAALRIEGFDASVAARVAGVLDALGRPDAERLDGEDSRRFWHAHASAHALAAAPFVWRISVPPDDAPRVVAALEPERYLLDWAGGLVSAAFNSLDVQRVRGAIRDGHATLLKAPREARAAVDVFQPQRGAAALAAARIKAAFDPAGRLNPGRFGREPPPCPETETG